MKINPTKTVNELVVILPYIIDVDDNKKIYHSWRVAIICALSAKNFIGPEQLKQLFYAALLHDIGGIGFPIHIIHYLKRRDKTSRNILLSHPIVGAQLISNIPQMDESARLILDHHEWLNGMGYPRAKSGKSIPWGSQVIRIADSIDIYLQLGGIKKLKILKDKMASNINKEYSQQLFAIAFEVLAKNRFFNKVSSSATLPSIFKDVQNMVGMLHINSKNDSIGKALEAIAQIIDMKHPFTAGHSLRVSRYAMSVGLSMGLEHDDITRIRWAGLIHDIGKLNVPRKVLDKSTKLTPGEFRRIKMHAHSTYEIMNMIETLWDITPIASGHHERYDGKGYPFGLKKDEIHLGSRILAVCDAFDAMTSNRPYRNPLDTAAACKEIKKQSGKQFDPEVVDKALPLFMNLGF